MKKTETTGVGISVSDDCDSFNWLLSSTNPEDDDELNTRNCESSNVTVYSDGNEQDHCFHGSFQRDVECLYRSWDVTLEHNVLEIKARVYVFCEADAGDYVHVFVNDEEAAHIERLSADECVESGGWFDWDTSVDDGLNFNPVCNGVNSEDVKNCYQDVAVNLTHNDTTPFTLAVCVVMRSNYGRWAFGDLRLSSYLVSGELQP